MPVTLEPARPDDLAAIRALLERSHLPVAEIERHLTGAMVARDDRTVIGCAAIEQYDRAALLRSVAVDDGFRGQGLGVRLTDAALTAARARGVDTVYLLTETAADFFPRFGFRRIPRDQVNPAVRRSVEFTTACPEGAQAMMAEL
jgi:amino-acid N-acetyltransferase